MRDVVAAALLKQLHAVAGGSERIRDFPGDNAKRPQKRVEGRLVSFLEEDFRDVYIHERVVFRNAAEDVSLIRRHPVHLGHGELQNLHISVLAVSYAL